MAIPHINLPDVDYKELNCHDFARGIIEYYIDADICAVKPLFPLVLRNIWSDRLNPNKNVERDSVSFVWNYDEFQGFLNNIIDVFKEYLRPKQNREFNEFQMSNLHKLPKHVMEIIRHYMLVLVLYQSVIIENLDRKRKIIMIFAAETNEVEIEYNNRSN